MQRRNVIIVGFIAVAVITVAVLTFQTTSLASNAPQATVTANTVPFTTVTPSSNGTILVKGVGFMPSAQVTSTINGDQTTAQSSQVAGDGSFTSTLKLQSNDTSGKTLHIISKEQASGASVVTDFVVP